MKEGEIKYCRFANNHVEITIISGKEKVKDFFPYNENMKGIKRGQTCQFEEKNRKVIKLIIEGKDVLTQAAGNPSNAKGNPGHTNGQHKNSKPNKHPMNNQSRRDDEQGYVGAPYNFVPINQRVVEAPDIDENEESATDAPATKNKIPSFDRYHPGRYTGYIELDITTLTPIYIRDTNNKSEEEKVRLNDKFVNSDFFSPGGRLRIPGSSLRGLTRNLVEIASCSRLEYVEDTTHYYRALADKCKSIQKEYQQNMSSRDRNTNVTNYKFNAGYLKRNGSDYCIIPAKYGPDRKQYSRIAKQNRPFFSWYWQEDGSCITVSGKDPGGKKRKDWLVNPIDPSATVIPISRTDLKDYVNDLNRFKDKNRCSEAEKQDGDLLRWLRVEENKEPGKKIVPCFYVCWKDEDGNHRVSFGHTAFFRLAYLLSVKKHLPISHGDNRTILDLTNAIFGQAGEFAGRVFFEDVLINRDDSYKLMEVRNPKILSSSKATTFQHYLEQANRGKDQLCHWNNKPDNNNPDGLIRGYKLYWHRKTSHSGPNAWVEKPENVKKSPSQYTSVRAVDKGAKFAGRIRFENLSTIELGALLFALELPDDCAHKIGMGKPLGLGSIRINPILKLTTRVNKAQLTEGRYGQLFDKQNWHLAEESKTTKQFKNAFANYMLTETTQNSASAEPYIAYWSTARMRELKVMLDFQKNTSAQNWLEKTRYMEIERKIIDNNCNEKKVNEFEKRPVLKSPSDTVTLAGIYYE